MSARSRLLALVASRSGSSACTPASVSRRRLVPRRRTARQAGRRSQGDVGGICRGRSATWPRIVAWGRYAAYSPTESAPSCSSPSRSPCSSGPRQLVSRMIGLSTLAWPASYTASSLPGSTNYVVHGHRPSARAGLPLRQPAAVLGAFFAPSSSRSRWPCADHRGSDRRGYPARAAGSPSCPFTGLSPSTIPRDHDVERGSGTELGRLDFGTHERGTARRHAPPTLSRWKEVLTGDRT